MPMPGVTDQCPIAPQLDPLLFKLHTNCQPCQAAEVAASCCSVICPANSGQPTAGIAAVVLLSKTSWVPDTQPKACPGAVLAIQAADDAAVIISLALALPTNTVGPYFRRKGE